MKLSLFSLATVVAILVAAQPVQAWSPQQEQEATIKVTEKGYEPAQLKLQLGVPARLTFVRERTTPVGLKSFFQNTRSSGNYRSTSEWSLNSRRRSQASLYLLAA